MPVDTRRRLSLFSFKFVINVTDGSLYKKTNMVDILGAIVKVKKLMHTSPIRKEFWVIKSERIVYFTIRDLKISCHYVKVVRLLRPFGGRQSQIEKKDGFPDFGVWQLLRSTRGVCLRPVGSGAYLLRFHGSSSDGSRLVEEDLAEWRRRYSLPSFVDLRVPAPEERSSSHIPGEIAVYEDFFDTDFRGVIPELVIGLCTLFRGIWPRILFFLPRGGEGNIREERDCQQDSLWGRCDGYRESSCCGC
ncbi:hypothetical protein Bca52824_027200 [Brassica carinata]|uniref:Uncharacterized protein n=1 Tax=Brassica carinata TaxID=52824 RepID=A0A8X7SJU2_BRACI|nr:hypothetical protein Bca52824_027200 [Brassica carinata]